MAVQTKGKCKYCGKEYAKGYMIRHLRSCKMRKEILEKETGRKKCGYFTISIYGRYDKDYWLIIEVDENALLLDLDEFLRDIWVECCGHLSSFEIDGTLYDSSSSEDAFWGPPSKNMEYKLKKVLREGMSFRYEYDFGDTTELVLDVLDYRKGADREEYITILSRNNPPEQLCDCSHEKKADYINIEWGDEIRFICEDCLAEKADDDEYDESMFSSVCNSPRMGVCAYDGSSVYPDQFVPDCEQGMKSDS